MPSKSKDEPQSKRLFVSEEGEPLNFYLRPGPMKRELVPLIRAGGGLMCNFLKKGTILLKDPEERASLPKSTAHLYVSTRYIQDCIEKNERLNIEEYRLIPESPNLAKKKSKSKVDSPALLTGRSAYTTEEDNAILSYVSKHKNEIGGNRLWQEMAKQQVTSHSWQSMKYHYRVQLVHKLSACKQADTENENKTTDTDQTETDSKSTSPQNIPVEAEDPENISAEMDLTQISADSREEQADVEPAKCHNSDSMETSKSEIDETPEQQQTNSSATEKDGPTETTAKTVRNSNDKSSPKSINRPVTRRQLELENIPYVKKLRSGAFPGSLVILPQHSDRSKPVSSTKRIQTEAQSPPKKVRRKTESNVAEQIQEERESGPSETTQIDEGNSLVPQPQSTEKKAEKRKLGILEMATKEFEENSESDSDLQCETPGPSTSIEAVKGSSNSVDPSPSNSENQEKDPATTQAEQNPQPTTTDTATTTAPATAHNDASASDPAISEVTTRGNPPTEQMSSKAHLFIFESESQELEEDSEVTTRDNPPTEQVSSKAHLFIFESESQEPEDVSQSLVGSSSSAAIPTNEPTNSPSLTQEQLEEDVQLLREFMKHTNQNLINVTKALLQASGDLFLAYEILQKPSSFSGPIWTRTDDQRLCSTDQEVRQDLLTKYGEEALAKRLQFLEIEG
ncbi:telomeric repeat-binding factor 2-interacting protein 1 [Periophthalmus magnuspinnatus]|uniref:telomeric repeat-binding factor 2-interacting protein 1 n=1 Tax=Periophthalmus magnuspinnatus TaxID=409849 RepID=UPI00145ABEED|nr:telomeric repeat-binding factor 2-interacting protein 1 [Periophthalmus magnuspinnatus]